jgi:molybdopterin-guanine dinucleotide biosynthesis protein A
MTDEFEINVRAVIAAPELPGLPADVRAALAEQDRAFDALQDHDDQHEHVLCSDWEERAERDMLVMAAADQDYSGLVDQRRTQRVAAIHLHRKLQQQLNTTAKRARAELSAWLRDPDTLAAIADLEADARAEELAAIGELMKARRAWLEAAGLRHWAIAAAVATSARMPDYPTYAGRPVSAGGGTVEQHQVLEIGDQIAKEHRRVDEGAERLGEDAAHLVEIRGRSGLTVTVPAPAARHLVSAHGARAVDDEPPAAA